MVSMQLLDIVIVGGGAVGVEIAGEIGDKYKMKKITLIHPSQKLVHPDFGDKFQTNIEWGLERCGVRLLLEDRVENLKDLTTGICLKQTVKTQKVPKSSCFGHNIVDRNFKRFKR